MCVKLHVFEGEIGAGRYISLFIQIYCFVTRRVLREKFLELKERDYSGFFCLLCSKVKMVTELLEAIHLVASIEAICLGVQAKIHPWILYDIISNAAGNSW